MSQRTHLVKSDGKTLTLKKGWSLHIFFIFPIFFSFSPGKAFFDIPNLLYLIIKFWTIQGMIGLWGFTAYRELGSFTRSFFHQTFYFNLFLEETLIFPSLDAIKTTILFVHPKYITKWSLSPSIFFSTPNVHESILHFSNCFSGCSFIVFKVWLCLLLVYLVFFFVRRFVCLCVCCCCVSYLIFVIC